ncbi:hypothetical protein EHQ76_13475 [Leptospira barantonii]|uniref:Uncharacterized protein n=1 Tax=Leptospira barantonii TaxID=2023184 RepID=A0A5F2B0N6_9LEPT|nr:ankyrin repeat domain-containing protein [Leptospira barantonii]TGL98038.1 hypothetical protein EHQ76_13475 [Leptospira barantonii]
MKHKFLIFTLLAFLTHSSSSLLGKNTGSKNLDKNSKAFYYAISDGNMNEVKSMIQEGANMNRPFEFEKKITPLGLATLKGHTEIMKLLIENGAKADYKNSKSDLTPLMIATGNEQAEALKILISNGAKVDFRETKSDLTALMYAVETKRYEIAKLLIENGADINAKLNQYEAVMTAAIREDGDENFIAYLIEKGANVNGINDKGGSLLSKAVQFGFIKTVSLMIQKGANVNFGLESNEFSYPIALAVSNGNLDIVKILTENGAQINAKPGRVAPLLLASHTNHPAIVKYLTKKGADVNFVSTVNGATITALELACSSNFMEVAEALLDHGGNPNFSGQKDGRTPLFLAAMEGNNDIIKLLLSEGADVNGRSKSGFTALFDAIGYNKIDTVKLLIKKGADVNVVDLDGDTPLKVAIHRKFTDIETLLRENGAK